MAGIIQTGTKLVYKSKLLNKELFRDLITNVFGKGRSISKTSEGTDLNKDFYKIYGKLFPTLYNFKQVRDNGKKVYKYYYYDEHNIIPIVEKMVTHKGIDMATILKSLE